MKARVVPQKATAILYQAEPEEAVKGLLKHLGVEPHIAGPEQLGAPVGVLAEGKMPDAAPWERPVPQDSALVLAYLPEPTLDAVLAALRQAGITIALKAVLTPHNARWPLGQLLEELAREHAAFAAKRAAESKAE